MRYRLNVPPSEVLHRLHLALHGGFQESFSPVWKTAPTQGFYGTVEADGFEIGYYDGLFSPHRRNLIRGRLLGRLEEIEGDCELHVSFWVNPLLIIWYAGFMLGIVMMLLHPDSDPSGRVFQFFWAGMVLLLLTGFTFFLLQVRRRNYQELERIFSGVILEEEKN